VLAWVASRRGNVAERLRWRGEIPQLMDKLLEVACARSDVKLLSPP